MTFSSTSWTSDRCDFRVCAVLHQIRMAERKLREENEELKARIGKLKRDMEIREKAADGRESDSGSHGSIHQVKKELQLQRESNEALMKELEDLAKAYTAMQEQNTRIAMQLSERDDGGQ